MSEQVLGFNVYGSQKPLSLDRKQFYIDAVDAFHNNVDHSFGVHVVQIFLVNSSGELIIQKRAHDKSHNAGLLDKSIGGHITFGDDIDYTAMYETIQELQVPSIVLKSEQDFARAYEVLGGGYLRNTALLQHLDSARILTEKNINGEIIPVHNTAHIYIGIYDGAVRTVDREAKGVLFYTVDELEKEMAQMPQAFTSDLHNLFTNMHKEDIKKFITTYCAKA